jgi:hypothetical protein
MAALGAIGVRNFAAQVRVSRNWANPVAVLGSSERGAFRYRPAQTRVISGTVRRNAVGVAGRTVAVYRMPADPAAPLRLLGATLTASDGTYSVPIAGYSGQVFVVEFPAAVGDNLKVFGRLTGV